MDQLDKELLLLLYFRKSMRNRHRHDPEYLVLIEEPPRKRDVPAVVHPLRRSSATLLKIEGDGSGFVQHFFDTAGELPGGEDFLEGDEASPCAGKRLFRRVAFPVEENDQSPEVTELLGEVVACPLYESGSVGFRLVRSSRARQPVRQCG